MKAQLIDLFDKKRETKSLLPVQAVISVNPFLRFLRAQVAVASNTRAPFFQYILDRISDWVKEGEEISIDKITDYREMFDLIYFSLSAPVDNENEKLWGLAAPFAPLLFFGTNGFYDLLTDCDGKLKENLLSQTEILDKQAHFQETFIYSFILQRCYNIGSNAASSMIHSLYDEDAKMNRYFKIEFQTDFIDVRYDGDLPELNMVSLQLNRLEDALPYLMEKLPLEKFCFEGFSIVNISDVTAQHAIDIIKDIIVNFAPGQKVYDTISKALKAMIGNNAIDISLFPVLRLNNQLVLGYEDGAEDELLQKCGQYCIERDKYMEVINKYAENPKVVFSKDMEKDMEDKPMLRTLHDMGIRGFAILPVFFQKKLVGVLEFLSTEKDVLNESAISVIEPTIPLLEQLLQATINNFNNEIDSVVKDKFTSLQPSVQWRFNEVAWEYLQQKNIGNKTEISNVHFADVYPLYGAIDIRNSTAERNEALRGDLNYQLQLLADTLKQLSEIHKLTIIDEMVFKTRNWAELIKSYILPDEEYRLGDFLENEITPFMQHFRQSYPASASCIDRYFSAINGDGVAFQNRRNLEISLQKLNTAIGNMLDEMNAEIQDSYPYYFEKFRSDGIEYDIYIGQSIAPQNPFHSVYLKNLRLWQLTSMAKIANRTQSLLPDLPVKLQTTQLIFIHKNTIDISFRSDEHRFDVEGAYNIRYEMIKKRIDKVHIKDSSERLTQPGKIALVYFQQKDIEEYLSFIEYLQSQHVLADDLEYLDLEPLQGVHGLKALRVGVVNNDKQPEVSKGAEVKMVV